MFLQAVFVQCGAAGAQRDGSPVLCLLERQYQMAAHVREPQEHGKVKADYAQE